MSQYMTLRETVGHLEAVAKRLRTDASLLGEVYIGNPEGCTRETADAAAVKLRLAAIALEHESEVLRRGARTFCSGEGCDEWYFVDELAVQIDGDMLCADCLRIHEENDAEREYEARACDRFNG